MTEYELGLRLARNSLCSGFGDYFSYLACHYLLFRIALYLIVALVILCLVKYLCKKA